MVKPNYKFINLNHPILHFKSFRVLNDIYFSHTFFTIF